MISIGADIVKPRVAVAQKVYDFAGLERRVNENATAVQDVNVKADGIAKVQVGAKLTDEQHNQLLDSLRKAEENQVTLLTNLKNAYDAKVAADAKRDADADDNFANIKTNLATANETLQSMQDNGYAAPK